MKTEHLHDLENNLRTQELSPKNLAILQDFAELYFNEGYSIENTCKKLGISHPKGYKLAYICRKKMQLDQSKEDFVNDLKVRYDMLYEAALAQNDLHLAKSILDSLVKLYQGPANLNVTNLIGNNLHVEQEWNKINDINESQETICKLE